MVIILMILVRLMLIETEVKENGGDNDSNYFNNCDNYNDCNSSSISKKCQ